MAAIPCPIQAPCDDDSNPIQNISAEAPDVDHFFSYGSGAGRVNTSGFGGPGGVGPRPGENFSATCQTPDGPIVCLGSTQDEADNCVQRLGQLCNNTTPGIPPQPPPTGAPTSPSGDPLFQNRAQQCTVFCPDGLPFTYEIGAGEFVGLSQDLANVAAFTAACRLAETRKICIGDLTETTGTQNQPFSAIVTVTGGTGINVALISGSLPAGIDMTVDGGDVLFSGTPTGSGPSSFTLKATNSFGSTMSKNFVITITAACANLKNSDLVWQTFPTQVGPNQTLAYSFVNGSDPSGATWTAQATASGINSGAEVLGEVSILSFVGSAKGTVSCVQVVAGGIAVNAIVDITITDSGGNTVFEITFTNSPGSQSFNFQGDCMTVYQFFITVTVAAFFNPGDPLCSASSTGSVVLQS